MKKRWLSMLLVFCMMLTMLPATALAVEDEETEELNVQHSYSNNGYTFEKVSHAAFGPETPDGVVDYLGDKKIAPYDGSTEVNNGDTVQSYSYCAVAYGDWVYMGTMYGALSAYTQIKNAMSGINDEVAAAVIDAMYNGMLNKGQEDDGYYAGSVFFKFNVKTGETKILMSRPMYEAGECTGVPIFRSAVEYNGKLYFVGLVSNGTALESYNGYPLSPAAALNLEIRMQTGVPSIYEVDPETDEVKKIYECVDVNGYRALNGNMDGKSVFTSTRAIGTYKDALIAGGIQIDARYPDGRPDGYAPGDACILASTNPSDGDFKVIATMEDLFDYPAIWRNGSSGGGGIYQVVEYNDSLYIAMVSGTYDTMDPVTRQFQPFAVVRGDYDASKGELDDRDAWTWTPVIGDLDDGAKYTFGIDPERTASSACTLQPYGGYLYIGEYNDVNGSLNGILRYKEFATLASNLEQSINLYRMDEKEEIEMVVGDATEMFPEGSLTGIGSGYESHMTQYTWMTTVYNGVMYLSTMDETSLTRPISYTASGLWLEMSPEEWKSQINYLKVLLELLMYTKDQSVLNSVEEDTTYQTDDLIDAAIAAAEERYAAPIAMYAAEDAAEALSISLTDEQREALKEGLENGSIEFGSVAGDLADQAIELIQKLDELSALAKGSDHEEFLAAYIEAMDLMEIIVNLLPDDMKEVLELLLNFATQENMTNLVKAMSFMTDAVPGFDLYAINQAVDGSVSITTVSDNGFDDQYNHGLRIFASTDDYLTIGTANPFLGTQLWRMSEYPLKEMTCTVEGFQGMYDANTHSISVTVHDPADAVITYSTDGNNYTETNPTYRMPGVYTVYYRVEADGYITVEGSESVEITARPSSSKPSRPSKPAPEPSPEPSDPSQPSEHSFTDVDSTAWFSDAVSYCSSKGLMKGTSDTNFSPNESTTRGMVVTILYRMAGEPAAAGADFTDVQAGSYYEQAVAWASAAGLVDGYGDGRFGPNDAVTREQLSAMLYRYAKYTGRDVSVGEDTNILSYNDAFSISAYSMEAIQWACGTGLLQGADGNLMPKSSATRAQLATILYRYLQ